MKVLFSKDYAYVGRRMGRYIFKDKFGDFLAVREAKYIFTSMDAVYMFLESEDDTENIQYSYSTARKLGLNFRDLRVTKAEVLGTQ